MYIQIVEKKNQVSNNLLDGVVYKSWLHTYTHHITTLWQKQIAGLQIYLPQGDFERPRLTEPGEAEEEEILLVIQGRTKMVNFEIL